MIHEVRIFDGQGNLKKTVKPVFDYDAKKVGSFVEKQCVECGQIKRLKKSQKFCSPDCAKADRARRARIKKEEAEQMKADMPKLRCSICDKPIAGLRTKYCSDACDQKSRKIMAKAKQKRTNEAIQLKRKEMRNAELRQSV